MVRYLISLLLCSYLIFPAWAQITTNPVHPLSNSDLEIIFDAGKGNKALYGINENIYFHAGLITSTSTGNNDWKFVQGNWGKSDPQFIMENLGGDKYRLIINPQQFFHVDSTVDVFQIAMVFRDAKGEKVAKTESESDFLIPLNGYKPVVQNEDTFKYPKPSFVSCNWSGNDQINLITTQGTVSFTFMTTDIIRATFTPKNEENIDFSSVSVILPTNQMMVNFEENQEKITFHKDKLRLEIEKRPLQVTYYYGDSLLLSEEFGFFERNRNAGIRFQLTPNEAIYGAGERAVPLNRRGYKLDLYNRPDYNYGLNARNLNYSMPVVISNKNYLLFFDNNAKGYVDIAETEENILEFASTYGALQYYIVAGESQENISTSYTELVGRQPLPPRWALGNLQSRMAYKTQVELEDIVDKMIKNDFPLDAVIIDFYWFGDSILGHLGNLKWYEKNWPNPQKMIRDFKEKGVKTILITEPYVIDTSFWFVHGDTSQLFTKNDKGETYIMKDFYFGHGALMDMFKTETKDWFWDQYQKQIEIGVAGWWGDLGEPETHPYDMIHINGTANQIHNKYAHEWAGMVFNKYREHYPDQRLFHLNRSGAAGTQRYSIFPWSGDVSRSWSGFQAQLPLMLNMSLCGLGYISSDLGGFAQGEKDEELYTRWLQMGVFNPVFRPHGSGIPSEPIFFSQQTQDIVRESIKLRYRLMPYIYQAAYENTKTGKPIVKPLFYYHPQDKRFINYSDTYYFGDELIVAPIIQKGQEVKEILLPKGKWYDFNTDSLIHGGNSILVNVSMENIPVFVKAGAFIPMLQDFSTTDRYPENQLYMHYYPGEKDEKSNYQLFEDDGTNANNLENQNYQLIDFKAINSEEIIDISVDRKKLNYQEKQESRRITWVIHHVESFPSEVQIDGERIFVYNILTKPKVMNIDAKYDPYQKILSINMPWEKDQFKVKIIKKN